ncbi:hypothetical protein LH51_10995, partial [Nitrincola sp. A-D6]|uniref:hypothetical protein n=1 Tax=Nitrincola sp. A-D6 TaxID=1545442 RepID=UPI00051FE2B3
QGLDGPLLARPIPDTEPDGSFGGRSTPRGVAVSAVGDLYLADPAGGRILYTRASLPPEAAVDSDIAPFVPLWFFKEPPEADHPLNLSQPVDLCLVPTDVPPGAFGDCLVIADAARKLLIWLDRRQILTRHVLSLPGTPISCASGPQGRLLHYSNSISRMIRLRTILNPVVLNRVVLGWR